MMLRIVAWTFDLGALAVFAAGTLSKSLQTRDLLAAAFLILMGGRR